MDIEQLRMILDMVSAAGANGKELFCTFMWVSVLKTFSSSCLIFAFLFYVVKLINKIITDYGDAERLRRAAGVSYRWSESELELACAILKQHFQK